MFGKFKKTFLTALIFLTSNSVADRIHPTDVVGRDLNYPVIGLAGHVGVATADRIWQEAHYVIEALNVPHNVLQINTLDNFKRRSPYWGAKFGINKDDVSGTKIINEGAFQASLKCAEYTYTVFWRAGTGQWGIPVTCPKFRCDTFVSYLYWWGGYVLPTYNYPGQDPTRLNTTYPRMVFNSFPYYRNAGIRSAYNIAMPKSSTPLPYANTINEITEEQIYNMPFLEFTHAVDLPIELLTQDGVDNIFKFADDSNLSDEKRLFLLDKLGFVITADMLPRLIDLYYTNQESPDLAHMILRDTQDAYQEENLLSNYPIEKQLLREFYGALLNKNVSTGIDPIVVRGFIALNTTKQILANKEKLNEILNDNNAIDPEISLALKISLAFKSRELETIYIPQMIIALQKDNKLGLDTLFVGAIAARLGSRGLNALQIKSKEQINRYLSVIKPRFITKRSDKKALQSSKTTDVDIAIPQGPGMWLEAKALVNASSFKAATSYITEYLQLVHKSGYKKYIVGLSNNSYMKKAFDSEPALVDFKKSNHEFYENTVGMPAR